MNILLTKFSRTIQRNLLALLIAVLPIAAQADGEAAAPEQQPKVRAMAVTMEAVVTAVDLETRHVTLEGPPGNVVTLTARDKMIQLEDVKVGDALVATYMAALELELREPTEEELAEPWLVVEDGAISEDAAHPGMSGARVVRAVCTVEGMNRILGTATLKDPHGKLHVIRDVEPEKMEGVTLGQTVVAVYAEAMALSLEHQ